MRSTTILRKLKDKSKRWLLLLMMMRDVVNYPTSVSPEDDCQNYASNSEIPIIPLFDTKLPSNLNDFLEFFLSPDQLTCLPSLSYWFYNRSVPFSCHEGGEKIDLLAPLELPLTEEQTSHYFPHVPMWSRAHDCSRQLRGPNAHTSFYFSKKSAGNEGNANDLEKPNN